MAYASGIGSGDFNGDGVRDLAVTQGSKVNGTADGLCDTPTSILPSTLVFLGTGGAAPGFTLAACLRGVVRSHNLTDVAAGDFNADGQLDLAVVDSNIYGARVYRGLGNGTFLAPVAATGSSGIPIYGPLTTADMNGDSRLDLVARPSGGVATFFGNGIGGLTFSSTPVGSSQLYQHLGVQAFAVGDLNNDGRLDIAGVERGTLPATPTTPQNFLFVSLNSGNGIAYASSDTEAFPLETAGSVALADFNRDGSSDVVALHQDGNAVRLHLGHGDGTVGPASIVPVGVQPFLATVGDWNTDSWLDLAIVDRNQDNQSRTWVLSQIPEATSPAGATVTLTGTGTDPDPGDTLSYLWTDGINALGTTPSITLTVPFGVHFFKLRVTDSYGAFAEATVGITVEDTRGPVLTLPGNLTVAATSPAGAIATFTASALDAIDGEVAVVCTPASGSTFPIGTTSVTCTATDLSGNTASGSFAVTVLVGAEPVVWTNRVRTSDSGNTLTKSGTSAGWDAGASSTKAIASGDGWAEFTVIANNVYWMAGLSNGDANTTYQDIDYAVYICGNGHAYVLEGANQQWLGAYTAGDVFRVEVEGGNLRYRKNGVTMYEHAVTPTYPLLLDTSMYTPSAVISNAKLSGTLVDASNVQNVVWTNEVRTSDSGNTLTKSGTSAGWDAGASSTKAIVSGDGYAEFTVTANNVYWMAGLSNGDSNTTYQDIDYAVYICGNGNTYALEGSTQKWLGTYTANDTFRVEIQNGNILYRKNGAIAYQHAVTPTYPLLLDTSMYSPSAAISNAKLSGTLVDVSNIQNVAWTNKVLTSDSGNSLTKTGTYPSWDAGASSTKAITSGDGWAEFTVTANNVYWMAGLSNGDTNTTYQDIDYRVYICGNGQAYALEGSTQTWLGAYIANDTFRVEIQGGTILYRKNGAIAYQHAVTPTYPLLLDTAMYTPGSVISNAKLSGTLQ